MSYTPIHDGDEYDLVPATWANLRDVQRVRMRSREVGDQEKQMVCQSYDWDVDNVCSGELTYRQTAVALAEVMFDGLQEADTDDLLTGVVFGAMRDFLSEARGGDDSGANDATALSQVLAALGGQTTETANGEV